MGVFDPPDKPDAFLDAVRRGAASAADLKNIQAPYRSGIDIEGHQRMTTSLLAVDAAAPAYLVVGSLHEEARLKEAFGDDYDAYPNIGVPFHVPAPNRSSLELTSVVADPEGIPQ